MSMNTFDGPAAIIKFVSDVSTRVAKVIKLCICIEYPRASGVWQMETTHGILYTLHNYFELDPFGLAFIYPMFDPKQIVEHPDKLVPWLSGKDYHK